jgi:hypothetical protein
MIPGAVGTRPRIIPRFAIQYADPAIVHWRDCETRFPLGYFEGNARSDAMIVVLMRHIDCSAMRIMRMMIYELPA